MKILSVKQLALPEIKVIRFAKFLDNRGYFSEPFRRSDFNRITELVSLRGLEFKQSNESFSQPNVVRGLHFQWNPFMGKLVRTLNGRMVDMAMDIRKGSPNYGKIILYDMLTKQDNEFSEWIWLPPGFAHGNFFTEQSLIEYYCTGEYSPENEAGIFPLSTDLDWSLVDLNLKNEFDKITKSNPIMSEKDKKGLSLKEWNMDERSNNFIYGKI